MTGRVQHVDPLWLLNHYRAAEIQGASAILRLLRLADSAQLRMDLTRHLRDESSHAWMWQRALEHIGGTVLEVDDPYQQRLAAAFGLPRTLTELLALTLVSENRGLTQYATHEADPDTPEVIRRTLQAILKDETWHVSYVQDELRRRAKTDTSVEEILDRAERADEVAFGELRDDSAGAPACVAAEGV